MYSLESLQKLGSPSSEIVPPIDVRHPLKTRQADVGTGQPWISKTDERGMGTTNEWVRVIMLAVLCGGGLVGTFALMRRGARVRPLVDERQWLVASA